MVATNVLDRYMSGSTAPFISFQLPALMLQLSYLIVKHIGRYVERFLRLHVESVAVCGKGSKAAKLRGGVYS